MKVKVSEATGTVLDWMVELCQLLPRVPNREQAESIAMRATRVNDVGISGNWCTGGQFLENLKEKGVSLFWDSGNEEWSFALREGRFIESGPTILIAGLRCYVASVLGPEVEVPEELLS